MAFLKKSINVVLVIKRRVEALQSAPSGAISIMFNKGTSYLYRYIFETAADVYRRAQARLS